MGLFDRLRRKSASASQDPREWFAEELAKLVGQHPSVAAVTHRRPDFALHLALENGGSSTLFLENLFVETRELAPEERSERIELFLRLLDEPQEKPSWQEARPNLMPALRGGFSGLAIPDALEDRPVSREVLPCLREHAVLDSPTSIAYLTGSDRDRWNVPEDEIFDTAQANLLAKGHVAPTLYEERPSRIWTLESEDSYEATRLLLPGFLASFGSRVDGRPIAIIPERSMIFIAGDARSETILRLNEMALREYRSSPRRLSFVIYTIDDTGKVVPYRRDTNDEVAATLRETNLKFVGTEYGQQKKELDALYEARGIDIFVADYSGIINPQLGPVSYCTWAHRVDSLLPETDLVVIDVPGGGDEPLAVDFERARQIAGNYLTREPGLFPPRWRTATDVPPEVYAALKRARVEL